MNAKSKSQLLRAAMMPFLALLCTTGACAEDSKVIITLTDGGTTEVLVSAMPDITYEDGNVVIKGIDTDLSWPISQMKMISFENASTDIKSVKTGRPDLLSGQFDAFDMSGKLVRKGAKSLSELPKVTYVVKEGSVTFKVVRK